MTESTSTYLSVNSIIFLYVFPDSESARETAKREVQSLTNKLQDTNEELHMREKELAVTSEDAKRNDSKAIEKLKNLENLLDNANQVIILRAFSILLFTPITI